MEDSEDATRAWMKFVEQAWPSPIDGGAPGTAPLTTNSRERIPWAIRNHRTIAGKTVMEVKEEAATICDAAVSFLARNTLARHESAAKERANHDRFGPLLNLPVGDFVEYVQREIIMKGHTDDYPVLEDFTQPKWKRYWETANLFHEDVIRWLLRPEVQLASLGRGSKMVNIYPYDSIIGPDGSKVRGVDDFATQVGVAAVNATRLMLSDPLRILGLMARKSSTDLSQSSRSSVKARRSSTERMSSCLACSIRRSSWSREAGSRDGALPRPPHRTGVMRSAARNTENTKPPRSVTHTTQRWSAARASTGKARMPQDRAEGVRWLPATPTEDQGRHSILIMRAPASRAKSACVIASS